jgi:uncharacterized protein YfkK (UPF0435 family)
LYNTVADEYFNISNSNFFNTIILGGSRDDIDACEDDDDYINPEFYYYNDKIDACFDSLFYSFVYYDSIEKPTEETIDILFYAKKNCLNSLINIYIDSIIIEKIKLGVDNIKNKANFFFLNQLDFFNKLQIVNSGVISQDSKDSKDKITLNDLSYIANTEIPNLEDKIVNTDLYIGNSVLGTALSEPIVLQTFNFESK